MLATLPTPASAMARMPTEPPERARLEQTICAGNRLLLRREHTVHVDEPRLDPIQWAPPPLAGRVYVVVRRIPGNCSGAAESGARTDSRGGPAGSTEGRGGDELRASGVQVQEPPAARIQSEQGPPQRVSVQPRGGRSGAR